MKTVLKKGIINTLAASGGNLFTDSVIGGYKIVADKTADPLVPIIPYSIKAKSVRNVRYVASAAEVRRAWTIGVTDTETIVASTKYTIEIGYAQYKKESTRLGGSKKYGFTSAAALTGTAATDRLNVFTALNNKINADSGNFVTSYLLTKVTPTAAAGDLNEVVVGTKVFQTDSTEAAAEWVGYVAYKPTSWSGAVPLYVYTVSGTLDATTDKSLKVGNYITGDGSTLEDITTDAANTAVAGQGLFIEDDAGYWTTPSLNRPGFSSVFVTNGFSATTPYITRDGVYAQGIGSEMLLHKPVYNYLGNDIDSGDAEYTFNADPSSAKTYTLAIIEIRDTPEPTAGENTYKGQDVELHLYMDESNSTNLTNLKSALTAIVGL
jgi:hypothetical protein